MNIAELFVRLRGDTSDLDRKLTQAEQAILSLNRGAVRLDHGLKQTGLSTGRLGNQFAGLAGQIAGVHPIVGNLAGVLGNFALGAGLTVGILAGVAAIAVVFDKLTEASTKAKKKQDELIESLEKALHLKSLGPGGETVDQAKAAKDRAAALGIQIKNLEALIVKDALDADVMQSNLQIQEKINKLVILRQNALNQSAGGQDIVDEKVNEAIKTAAEAAARKAKELAAAMKKASEEAGRYAQYMYEASKWTALTGPGLATTTLKAAQERLGFKEDFWGRPAVDFTPEPAILPGISITAGLTKKQLRVQEQILNADEIHAAKIESAILDSAQVIGSAVMSALSVGGGGKGSQIGGMIGSGLGMVAGSFLGPSGSVLMSGVGKVLGGVVGGIAGSLLGGLFDSHKKEVNANTQALRALTAEIHNAPSGFKIAQARYNATDVSQLGTDLRRYRSRGGKNPLLAGT